jgi:hypothetical protein
LRGRKNFTRADVYTKGNRVSFVIIFILLFSFLKKFLGREKVSRVRKGKHKLGLNDISMTMYVSFFFLSLLEWLKNLLWGRCVELRQGK